MTARAIAEFLRVFHDPNDPPHTLFIATSEGDNLNWREAVFSSTDLEAAAKHAARAALTRNVYFTHGHSPVGSTSRGAPSHSRAFCADLDAKPGAHPDTATAMAELERFASGFGLQPSLIVGSGGGLQAWWVARDLIPQAGWCGLAARLAAATSESHLNLKCDRVCTTGMARVMRLPPSSNFKSGSPRPVSIIGGGSPFEAIDISRALIQFEPGVDKEATARSRSNAKFIRDGGLDPLEFCPQLKKSLLEGGSNDNREVWTKCLQFACALDEPLRTQTAIRLSERYRGNTDAETLNTLATFKYPPLCAEFDKARPGICNRCMSRGAIRSPISLMQHKIVLDPAREKAIAAEIDNFKRVYAAVHRAPTKASADAGIHAIAVALEELKARDAELAKDCAYKLMAAIHRWGWSEETVRRAGVGAGLSEGAAVRWALKLAESKEARGNRSSSRRTVQ